MVGVGVVGYGHLGQYLVESIRSHPQLELAWVWNRSSLSGKVEDDMILEDLNHCDKNSPDVIVEVAHPDITRLVKNVYLFNHVLQQTVWCQVLVCG